MRVKKGDKWGGLECVSSGDVELEVHSLDENGEDYVSETRLVQGYVLKCGCGRVLKLPVTSFRGKRVMRDCGCGSSVDEGMTIMMTFTMKEEVRKGVVEYARVYGVTKSRACSELIKLGLSVLESREGEEAGEV